MFLTELSSNKKLLCEIVPVAEADYRRMTKKRYAFDWKAEKLFDVYKIKIAGNDDILGLISLQYHDKEYRIQIRLIAVSAENFGKLKQFEGITGNLIAYACRVAVEKYNQLAAVSLIPKTLIRKHYMTTYGFVPAGNHLFLEKNKLKGLIKKYGYD